MSVKEVIQKIDLELSQIKTDRDTHFAIFRILKQIYEKQEAEKKNESET